jgi:hypothetical protein
MITDYFELNEVVCPEVYHKYGDFAWNFFDSRLLITMEALRQRLNKPITVNNWKDGGEFSQRGFRCVQCHLMISTFQTGELFVDPHTTGKAWDFDVQGLVAEEVRQYIIKNKNLWPYQLRLEDNVSWVHLDIYNNGADKVVLFNT